MIKSVIVFTILLCLTAVVSLQGCSNQSSLDGKASVVKKETEIIEDNFPNQDVIWAVNVGGAEHLGLDGIRYQADTIDSTAAYGRIDSIRGAQDTVIYKTYKMGEMHMVRSLPSGLYDISFMFAEPDDVPVGARSFNVLAEGEAVIKNMDVRLLRDGNHQSSLDTTVVNVEVNDGTLNLHFQPIKGRPILNGLVVRRKYDRSNDWEMVWNDEFENDGSPDSNKWSYDVWPAGKVNNEDQAYTNRRKNVRVEDGNLILEAHKENYDDAKYTSGRIHSLGKGDFLYGKAVIRAKLPAGQGTWSAIWMLPSEPFKYATNCAKGADWQGNDACDAWPNSGEIDIMEHVGYDMNRVHGTVHTKDYYWVKGNQRKASVDAKNVSEAYHIYTLEWTPNRIDIFFDGTPYFTYVKNSDAWEEWPFDHPFHIILNLAIGGGWGLAGGPIDEDVFPTKMQIDYVRVYELADKGGE